MGCDFRIEASLLFECRRNFRTTIYVHSAIVYLVDVSGCQIIDSHVIADENEALLEESIGCFPASWVARHLTAVFITDLSSKYNTYR